LKRDGFEILLYKNVISKGLCTACGACVGVCPNNAIFIEGVIPKLRGSCEGCGSCYQACPGKEIRIDLMEQRIFGRARKSNENRIGIHTSCYTANSTNTQVRKNATSGGVITGLLMYAFEKDLIDGALVTAENPGNPARPMPMVATSLKDLASSQKTKYMLIPGGLLSALREAVVEKRLTRIAVVGSPCHIHAVRKIQTSTSRYLDVTFGQKIKYTLGLHCAFNFFPEGTDAIIQALGLNIGDVKSVSWRDTSEIPFPGRFCVESQTGEKRSMDLLQEYIILGGIYDHPRCRICYDWANEVADISSGDEVDEYGFHRPGSQRSHTVVRTSAGKSLFKRASNDGYIEAQEITEADVAKNLGFAIKKLGNIPRIEERRRLGLPLPEFGNYPVQGGQ